MKSNRKACIPKSESNVPREMSQDAHDKVRGEEREQTAAPRHQSVRQPTEEQKKPFAMKKAVLYGRISAPEQHLESQFIQLREIATQRGLELTGVYSDFGVSGSKGRRPGIDSLLRDARRGKFSVILVVGFDRLAKSAKSFWELVRELDTLGVELISAKEAVDTASPTGRVFVAMLDCIEKLHKSLNRERIKAGMRRRKLDGLPCGRQPLNVDHESLLSDRLSDMSLTEVAKRYGVSRASVVRWVREAKQRSSTSKPPFTVCQELGQECAA
jgi:DNA invertase Pin-like site-specific DNA recombinase